MGRMFWSHGGGFNMWRGISNPNPARKIWRESWSIWRSSRQVHCGSGCLGCNAETCSCDASSAKAWWGALWLMFVVVLFLSLHFFFVSLDGMFRKGGLDGVRVLNKKKVEMFSKQALIALCFSWHVSRLLLMWTWIQGLPILDKQRMVSTSGWLFWSFYFLVGKR